MITAGNACLRRVSPRPLLETQTRSEHAAGGTAPLPATGQPARARRGMRVGEAGNEGGSGGARLGPLSYPRLARRESAASEGAPGCLGASYRGGTRGLREVLAACAPARPPHTVSQQHRSRLTRPRSAAAARHKPSGSRRAGEGARRPLPMECRMSMDASRSVLSRDWALWNSTTAAAAILPLSDRPGRGRRRRKYTPGRSALALLFSLGPQPRFPEHHGSRSLSAALGTRVRVRAGAPP